MVKKIRRSVAAFPKTLARKVRRGSTMDLEVIGRYADVIFLSQRSM